MKFMEETSVGILSFFAFLCILLNIGGVLESPSEWELGGWGVGLFFASFFGILLAVFLTMSYSGVKVPSSWALLGELSAILSNGIVLVIGIEVHQRVGTIIFGIVSLLAPLILIPLLREKKEIPREAMRFDPELLETAKKYGGIITKSVVVYEHKVPLELAERSLRRFEEHGECERKKREGITIYDFKSARVHLGRAENNIVNLLRDHPFGLPRATLLRSVELSLEALEEVLTRLERYGIVTYDKTKDEYKLRGIVM